jgi:hypothetical protein
MFQIMLKHYAGVDRAEFEHDMSEKDGAIVMLDDAGRIQGFSTFLFIQTVYQQDEIVALFSGDTIIDQEHWGSMTLFRTFGKLLFELMDGNPGKKTYWFLITKGYRTYLMLPVFFNKYYPRYDEETPPYEKGLIEHLANTKYNGKYDRQRGIIKADSYYLRDELARIPEGKQKNPKVRFFIQSNPGYTKGEELACVCEIRPEYFRKRTKTLVRP